MGKTRRLNRDKVIAAAVAMTNEAGDASTLTLADLAGRLDIRTPSLYNHIKNLDDLHRGLAIYGTMQLQSEMEQAARGKVGRAAVYEVAHAFRRFALQNPGVYPLMQRAPDPDDVEMGQISEQIVHFMQLLFASFGLGGDDALHAVRGLRSLAHGFVSLELSGGFGLPISLDETYTRLVDTFLDGISR